ncbi:MAG: RlmI/RlmK family 23S rRNA methyltransferase [Proteobacteria bacterium]|nr:MAG: RlmI/RlmK family 23S rRNA methyltransferase [Pseudomonadota bacterium]
MSALPEIAVILKRGKSKPLWLGHPWIFSGAVHKVRGPVGDTGGPCEVVDERGNVLGYGHYNPHGQIAVRLLQHRRTTELDFAPEPFDEILRARLHQAVARRRSVGLPAEDTDVFRLVNAEGDLLSGLVVDRLGDVAVAQLGSRAMYDARELVASLVRQAAGVRRVALSINETASRLEAIPVMHEVYGEGGLDEAPGAVQVRERGVRFEIDLANAQKTGFYADQRDNRQRFAKLCEGRSVLDAYSYTGGFGINAALAGATSVVMVDSSKPAIEQAVGNAALNGVADRITGLHGDAVTFLKETQGRGDRFERIVCDPPKLARGRAHLDDALKKYARINTLAMSALEPGGLLLTCSCSRHVSPNAFARMLTESGHRLRRSVQVLATWGQPTDHPTLSVAPEGRYLKAYLVAVA